MEKNVSKLIKKMLSEQGVSKTGGLDKSQGITNSNLKMAYQLNCYDAVLNRGGIVDKWGDEEVIKLNNSSKKPGYPIAVLYSPDNKGVGKLEYFSADGKNKYTAEGNLTYFCQKMTSIVEDSLKPEFKEFIDKTRENNPTIQIYSYGDTSDTVSKGKFNGSCKLQKIEDLLNERPDLKPYLGSNTQIFVWNCGQVKGGTFSAQEGELIKLGYAKCTDAELVPGAFLGTIKKVGEVSYCKPKVGGGKIKENPTYIAITNALKNLGTGPNKEGCRSLIDNYYKAATSKLPIPQNEIDEAKDYLIACKDDENIKLDRFLSNKITKTLGELEYMPTYKFRDGSTVSYKLSTGEAQIRESVLKRIIRENLNELSESKKKSLVEEYNIINLRFNIITESRRPKTKKQKEKFVDDIINEIFYLKSQGFNETLINEQFLDIVKSFFGQVPGGIFDTLKERFAQFILEKLGIGTDGYLANIFIATIGDIPIGDYANGKIFDCQYLSNAISKGVGEGIARKIQKEQGMEGPFYDIVRNAMVDMFTDSSFGDKIENALGQMICPSLPKLKEKFNSAGETMKEKALS